MEMAERMTSKQTSSSAVNCAHAKVQGTQKVPDMEKNLMKGTQMWRCKHGLSSVWKVTFWLTTKPLLVPAEPVWTSIFSLEGHDQPNHWLLLSPNPDRLSSPTSFVLLTNTEGFGHLLFKVWGMCLWDASWHYREEGNSRELLSLRNS